MTLVSYYETGVYYLIVQNKKNKYWTYYSSFSDRKKNRSGSHVVIPGWLDKKVVLYWIELNDILVYKAAASFIIECEF